MGLWMPNTVHETMDGVLLSNGVPDGPRYCIQSQRIIRMESKLDAIDRKVDEILSVEGTIGKLSIQMEHLTTLIENGNGKKKQQQPDIWKWLGLSVLVLALIIATLLGVDLPF